MPEPRSFSRRTLLGGMAAGAAAAGLGACSTSNGAAPTTTVPARPSRPAGPGDRPDPSAHVGTDRLPQIRNIIILMMENHSYDSILGMQRGRGDGFTLGTDGHPVESNPWPGSSAVAPPAPGLRVRAFPMPNPCQQDAHPYNTWAANWTSYDGGRNDGFVRSPSGPVAMGYYTADVMPFVYSLADTFPVCDRWFCSVGAQTYPNRRFLMAGTSLGVLTDTFTDQVPPNGTIFQALDAHGISWQNYYTTLPSSLIWSYQNSLPGFGTHLTTIDGFFSDAAAGTLPQVSLVDPNFDTQSEEDPQDVQYGDQFMAKVIDAVTKSPQWPQTLLVWTYDESGGYYDHVPPPRAVVPDSVPPDLGPGDPAGTFDRYGFRVPSGVVSPYARPGYVSHVVHDHTSILKLIETKWNLPALTYRDAAADDLLDSLDLTGPPAFLHPPRLAAGPDPGPLSGCLVSGPGTIPPPAYVTA